MWYFAWILGTAFACAFAILNAVWFELRTHSTESEADLLRRR